MGYLNDLAKRIHDISTSKGFVPPSTDNMDQKLLLVVSEVCEAQDELRNGRTIGEVRYELDDQGVDKPEGFHVECADAIIRLLHIMSATGADIEDLIEMKVDYNERRPHMHGRKF